MIVLMSIGWTGNRKDMQVSCKTGLAAVGSSTGFADWWDRDLHIRFPFPRFGGRNSRRKNDGRVSRSGSAGKKERIIIVADHARQVLGSWAGSWHG